MKTLAHLTKVRVITSLTKIKYYHIKITVEKKHFYSTLAHVFNQNLIWMIIDFFKI